MAIMIMSGMPKNRDIASIAHITNSNTPEIIAAPIEPIRIQNFSPDINAPINAPHNVKISQAIRYSII